MSFKAMILGGALILAAGSVVAFAGEDHPAPIQTENADDDVTDAKVKVKAKSDKRHKLSETDFKKIEVKTFDEAAFRDDDEVDGAVDDDDEGDDPDGTEDSGTGGHTSEGGSDGGHDDGDDSGDSGDS